MSTSALATLLILAAAAGGVLLSILWQRYRRRARRLYQKHLELALADGVLTPAELRDLDSIREQAELTAAETRMVALSVYRRALRDVQADARITEEEAAHLANLQQQLGLSEHDLAHEEVHVQRVRLLQRAERGPLEPIRVPFPLETGEHAYWLIHCTLCERLAYPGVAARQPANVAFTIAGSEPFSVGARRDPLGPNPQVLPLDLGVFVITNRAAVFHGAKRNLRIEHRTLRSFAVFMDGLRLDAAGKAHYFLVSDPELTGAFLLRAARAAQTPASGTHTA